MLQRPIVLWVGRWRFGESPAAGSECGGCECEEGDGVGYVEHCGGLDVAMAIDQAQFEMKYRYRERNDYEQRL